MKLIKLFFLVLVAITFLPGAAEAGLKKKLSPEGKKYDFKAVSKIVMMPITSKDVTFGKVDKKRLPKIQNVLRKTKGKLRKQVVEGCRLAKCSIPFYYEKPNRRPTTLIMKFNIDEFDNGHQAARLIPFAGRAKVTMTATLLDAETDTILATLQSRAKDQGGAIGMGGFDSEVLWTASKVASSSILRYVNKKTGLKYKKFSNLGKQAKMGGKDYVDIFGEEKHEAKRGKSKKKK